MNLTTFSKWIRTYLQRILWGLKPMKITKTIGSTNGTRKYHRCSKWPTCSWREDGYSNIGNFPGAYHIRNSLHYQDLERRKSHEITYPNHDEIEYENETHDERHKLCEASELPVCNIRRFKMIKYSFGQDEEYLAVKDDEYDDFVKTSDDVCRAYQEIFRMMDKGWMVTRAE
ncbi:hypothetical protein Tco_0058715 [Tanacetum coccineum]